MIQENRTFSLAGSIPKDHFPLKWKTNIPLQRLLSGKSFPRPFTKCLPRRLVLFTFLDWGFDFPQGIMFFIFHCVCDDQVRYLFTNLFIHLPS